MASIQFLSLGLLGEVSARIYYNSQNKQHYAIREVVNLEPACQSQPSDQRLRTAA
jgi:hypothetical protein